jgi:hypothetical protein
LARSLSVNGSIINCCPFTLSLRIEAESGSLLITSPSFSSTNSDAGWGDDDHSASRVDVWQVGQMVGSELGNCAWAGRLVAKEDYAGVVVGGTGPNVGEPFVGGE